MITTAIKNARIVNRGKISETDILIKDQKIEKIGNTQNDRADAEFDAENLYVFPGIIDDQVHFREPGLTHKANIFTESRAAVAGGVTSFMEMPNTKPAATTRELLENKYRIAAKSSLANYSFYMGVTNDNLEEVLKTDKESVCGIKIFMGSSTGNMLVDDVKTLENIFANSPLLIATHCEDEATIRRNMQQYRDRFGEDVPVVHHPEIRNAEGCYISSSMAVELAKKNGSRLHVLHISTEEETGLFENNIPIEKKLITSEVCVHHLYFNSGDYQKYGSGIKCNPAIKSARHQNALFEALLNDKFDVIATDHAPHTWEEKQANYFISPSGVPLVQHTLNIMLEFYYDNRISLEKIVEKMCHAPAICFGIKNRGFVEEGMYADLALVDLHQSWEVKKENLHYKCNWSPFEGHRFKSNIIGTYVNGHLAYYDGKFDDSLLGKRLSFYA